MLRWLYNLLFPLALLALLPAFLRRMVRRGNYRRDFGQRLGFYSAEVRQRLAEGGRRPWIQAVSVGEMFIALKLMAALRKRCPGVQMILSTTTTTAMLLARARAGPDVEIVYTPVDARFAVRRAISMLRPSQITVVEGGLWPNLLWEAKDRQIPTTLASARLSPRSERRFRRFPAFSQAIFRLLDVVCVPETSDVQRWVELGVDRERVVCTGNVKFDGDGSGEATSPVCPTPAEILLSLGVDAAAPILLAASTHPGEERILADAFLSARERAPALFMVVAPRHAERGPEILRELTGLGLSLAVRSRSADAPSRPDALLLDSTGELRDWTAAASIVVVGKSLAATGGQNPAEAAAAGKPVLFGPHMENFASLAAQLLHTGAAIEVRDAPELATQVTRLLEQPALCAEMGARGRSMLETHAGAAWRTAEQLVERGGFSPCR